MIPTFSSTWVLVKNRILTGASIHISKGLPFSSHVSPLLGTRSAGMLTAKENEQI